MTWLFSHCPNDPIQDDGESGCAGCPAICDNDGQPRADQCAAVFVSMGARRSQIDQAVQVSPPPPVRPPYSPTTTLHLPKVVVLSEAQNWRCAYCGDRMGRTPSGCATQNPTDASIDHVLAINGGGKREWDNEIAACSACNSHKGQYSAMLFWLLMQRHGGDRTLVGKMLRTMTKKQRTNMLKRLNRAMGKDQQLQHVTPAVDGPQIEGRAHPTPHPDGSLYGF